MMNSYQDLKQFFLNELEQNKKLHLRIIELENENRELTNQNSILQTTLKKAESDLETFK